MKSASIELDHVYHALRPLARPRRSWRSPLRPAVRLLRTMITAWRYGPPVAHAHGVSIPQQMLKLYSQLRLGFTGEDFYRYRMYQMSREQASLFVSLRSNIAVRSTLYRKLGLDPSALADKRRFGRASRSAGLPVPVTIADFADGKLQWWEEASLPQCDLFVKEAASMCGAGAMTWTWTGPGKWTSLDLTLDAAALLSHLAALSAQAPLLLQQRLLNHPDLAELGPHGLCTVRVVTVRAPDGNRPEILLSAFRMPTGNEVADNFALGGLACAVDTGTGMLGVAVRKNLRSAHIDVARHPDTGAVIAGRRLPWWKEVVELALRAHQAFSDYPSVGWDVAITSTGPVLLEANYNWDVVLGQQACRRPLGATKWPQHYLEWARWAESHHRRSTM